MKKPSNNYLLMVPFEEINSLYIRNRDEPIGVKSIERNYDSIVEIETYSHVEFRLVVRDEDVLAVWRKLPK